MANVATPRTANELAQDRTDLAAARTMMSADRTLMAWVRTALSMDSFGFTIYKVLQAFQNEGRVLRSDHTPANVGIFLTVMGTFAMVLGIVEYLETRKEIQPIQEVPLTRPAFVVGLIMAFFGVVVLFGILVKAF